MAPFLRRKSLMILALAVTLTVALLTLALDDSVRDRLGDAFWVIGLSICGCILLVLAGYVWDQTLLSRVKAITETARQNAAPLAAAAEPEIAGANGSRGNEGDEIIGLARQIERMAQTLQTVEASYRSIVEDQVDLICRYRADGRITFVNDAMAQFFGSTRQALLGQRAPFFDRGLPTRTAQGLLPTTATFEIDLASAVGTRATYQWSHRAVTSGQAGALEYQAVGHDISLRKQAERALDEAKRAAESADRVKTEFLAAASVELGGPAQALVALTQSLQHTVLTTEQRATVERIQQHGQRLDSLINEVLQLSRIEAGRLKVNRTSFALRRCLEETVARTRQGLTSAPSAPTVTVAPCVPDTVNGDPLLLQQILDELLTQALRRTPTGDVAVSVTCIRGDDLPCTHCRSLRLFVAVTDHGRAFSEEELAHLFQPFGARARRDSDEDCPLGLVVAKRLAELMGGAMSAESRLGEGSTFRFSIALDFPVQEAAAPSAEPEKRLRLMPQVGAA